MSKKKRKLRPLNLNPLMATMFAVTPAISKALKDNKAVTVHEAIDIAATAAKTAATSMGIADRPIATTAPEMFAEEDDGGDEE